jgi:cob(I)alamin adenosyltransferase
MKKIIGIVLAAACLLGCKPGKKELHDPLLRQQLTMIISSLNDKDDSVAKKALDDLDAILAVNSTKLSDEQSKKLRSAQNNLWYLYPDISTHKYDEALGRKSTGMADNKKDIAVEISDLVSETKKLIGEVAATL